MDPAYIIVRVYVSKNEPVPSVPETRVENIKQVYFGFKTCQLLKTRNTVLNKHITQRDSTFVKEVIKLEE